MQLLFILTALWAFISGFAWFCLFPVEMHYFGWRVFDLMGMVKAGCELYPGVSSIMCSAAADHIAADDLCPDVKIF